jgi:peptidyl-prolyl cis-trans isomerase SurA
MLNSKILCTFFCLQSIAVWQVSAQKKVGPAQKQAAKPAAPVVSEDDKPIIRIGSTQVPFREFRYVYNKNNSNASDAGTEKSVKEYVELYVNFKLKVMDAEKEGLDTTNSFKKELEGYRKQLAKPYLTDKAVTQKLVAEAYERMKEEVNASHILIKCDPKADPKDTLAAYNRIMELRKKILAGEDFAKLAKESSEDPSAKYNDGNLGYFTAMQMVYPFEDAAYKTAKGSISSPVRTQFGYHILKVSDRRPSQGQITVAHIMVRANPGMPAEDSLAARKKIFDIYERLKKGGNFSALALEFSDHGDSKTKGGILPPFGTGTMVPSFENASFALKDTGNYSSPFLTPFGWHIVKLVNRKTLEPLNDLKASLESKVSKDSRSELNRSILIAKLRKDNGFSENKLLLNYALSKADTNLTKGNWKYDMADKRLDETLITIKEKKYSLRDFWKYAEKKQQKTDSKAPEYQMKLLYRNYSDDCVMEYEETHLGEKYEDYKMLVKEYRDGILLFTLMDQKVWTKALEDTAGLRQFHSGNRKKYTWGERAKASIFSCANERVFNEVKENLSKGKFSVTDSKFESLRFGKKNATKGIMNGMVLRNLAEMMKKDKTLTVSLPGYITKDEKSGVALKRSDYVADSLVSLGIDRARITSAIGITTDKTGANPEAENDEKNRKVNIVLYSTNPKVLERSLNAAEPLSLNLTEGLFQKEENKTLDLLKTWNPGTHIVENNGRKNYIIIEALEAPREKTFEEARGAVISDYQNYLEKQWIDSMKTKTSISIEDALVQKLITK